MKKFIAVYGGSFNPSTKTHLKIGRAIRDSTGVDEVWYLVSPQNRLKSTSGMASFSDRLAMVQLNIAGESKLMATDIEARYMHEKGTPTIETAETLRRLAEDFPEHRFAWTMGADNLASLHLWTNFEFILDNFPLIIVPRPGYTEQALSSPAAHYRGAVRLDCATDTRTQNGWFLLDGTGDGINATECRQQLAADIRPDCMRPEVTNYAFKHKVYAPH